ncbi:MAG: AarF/ABC1/UbiB kinase family protein [Actinomycetota bacterium]|nr:AarF/ABC1/UbiB kinase family protein [Actinomycetota bacterium]
MPLAGLTARVACGRLVAGLQEKAGQDGAVERFHRRSAARYSELLGRSRGVLMKAAQILSMADNRDWGGGGFGPYLDALGQVQAEVPAMDPLLVRRLLDAEVDSDRFAEFDEQPVASASIGQVHRAVLRDGRAVAVKVQYPGVARAIRDDLANAELLVTFLQWVRAATAVRADIRAVAREAAARIGEEIDYRHEAQTITTFAELYRGHPFIRIPQVVPEVSGDRVLTMTYLDGMDWCQARNADQELRNAWAEGITRFLHSNGRLSNLMHGDPHPANYRFFPDGTVGCLDFGCVQVFTEHERWVWFSLLRAAMEGRKSDLRDLAEQAGFLDSDPTLAEEELYQWAAELLCDVIAEPQPVTYTPQVQARVLRNMFSLKDSNHVMARVSFPRVIAFTGRQQLGLVNICTLLGATLPVRAIFDDTDGVAEPVTALGAQHHAWVAERGLSLPRRPDHP